MRLKKILIIDDDIDLSEEIAETLRDEAHYVEIAPDGVEGYSRIQKNKYDLIILDYKIPGLNGLDILKLIRDNNIKTKIFLSSGRPFIEKLLMDENLSNLVTHFINKPFNAKTLLENINAI